MASEIQSGSLRVKSEKNSLLVLRLGVIVIKRRYVL